LKVDVLILIRFPWTDSCKFGYTDFVTIILSYAELDLEQPATVPSALPLLAYMEQPTSRRCHFTVAGNFQETA